MAYQLKPVLVLFCVTILSACNGSSDSGPVNNDNVLTEQVEEVKDASSEPTIEIELLSPSYSQATTSREFTVSGTASDVNSGIRSVVVNGIEALSEDDFNSWRVGLPLDKTISKLEVQAENGNGYVEKFEYAIQLSPIEKLFSEPSSLGLISDKNKLFILDSLQKVLFEANTAHPSLKQWDQLVTLHAPQKLVYDERNERFIILDQRKTRPASQALISISISDKTATILKEGLSNIIDISLDEEQASIYFLSADKGVRSGASIKVYEPSTDSISEISNRSHTGPAIEFPSHLFVIKNKVIYIERSSDQLMSANIKTGARKLVSPSDAGISLQGVTSMASNQEGSILWASDVANRRIISINMSTGAREIISGQEVGRGLNFKAPKSIAYDKKNERLLVGDSSLNLILSVDISSGDRQFFISNRHGIGPSLEMPVAVETVSNELAYVVDEASKSLFMVDLKNGNRQEVSVLSKGGQDSVLKTLSDLSVDVEVGKAWVLDKQLARLFEIDLSSGELRGLARYREEPNSPDYKIPVSMVRHGEDIFLSDIYHDVVFKSNINTGKTCRLLHSELSDGVRIQKVTAIDIDKEGRKLIGIDQVLKSVYVFELQSGVSRLISSPGTGSGINFVNPIDIQFGDANEIYVADAGLNAIVRIDINNGNRSVLSNASIGGGPVFKSLSGLSYDQSGDRLIAVDKDEKALFSIDVSNGDRAIISR